VINCKGGHGFNGWSNDSHTSMPALRNNVGMWRGKLSRRVSVPNFDSVHKMLGPSSAKRGVCRGREARNVESP